MSSPSPEPRPEVSVTEARGAIRTGRAVWILAISLGLAVVLVLGLWVLHSPGLGRAERGGQGRDVNSHDLATYNQDAPSARANDGSTDNSQ